MKEEEQDKRNSNSSQMSMAAAAKNYTKNKYGSGVSGELQGRQSAGDDSLHSLASFGV